MALTLTAPPLTVKDYLAEPEGGPRWELIGGNAYIIPSPNEFHQRASVRLTSHIHIFLQDHDLGEVFSAPSDVFLEELTAVQPDILFVARDNPQARIEGGVWGTPDLIVEILSPSNAARDLGAKRRIYQQHRVRGLWFVDPQARRIVIDRLGAEGYGPEIVLREGDVLTSPVLPGFELPVAKVFA
jgi:Uma2 family endonuclease